MLMRWDPFREFDRLTEQLTSRNQYRGFPMDAYRRGEQFYVHFDLPGIDPHAIDLTVEHNVLTVKVERDWQPKEGDEVLVVERPRGSFSRQLFLGENLDASKVSADYESGVLTLTIPMAEKAKPHKVEINVGSSQSTSIEASTGHEAA